jgi:hypothetical protein
LTDKRIMSRSLTAGPALSLSLVQQEARPISALLTPPVLLVMACVFLLVPFLSKPLHIDDPMYVWAAKHVLHHPLDPYGFAVNWGRATEPMFNAMQNPPLMCYYLAGMMLLLGQSEAALHLAMMLPAIGLILGVYHLAKEFTRRPALAAAATLLAPGILLSASTVMCDITMMCAYVWAIWFWVRGIQEPGRFWMLIVASVLIAASTLSKYFGVTLFPLLVVYGFFVRRRAGLWLLPLLIPAAILLAYQLVTKHLYGHGLLTNAASYATQSRWGSGSVLISAMTAGLTFTGGCCASVALLALVAVRRRIWLLLPVGVALLVVGILIVLNPVENYSMRSDAGHLRWGILAQIGIWSLTGAGVLMMGIAELWRRRDAASVLLACWIAGTFCFAVFVNWNVAARSIAPMVPAAAIIAARWWEQADAFSPPVLRGPAKLGANRANRRLWLPYAVLAPAGALAVLLLVADNSLARCARDAASAVSDAVGDDFNGNLTFCGHWGFHEYMARIGAQPLDVHRDVLRPGDIFVQPDNNTSVIGLGSSGSRLLTTLEFQPLSFVSTMQGDVCAGFYSDVWGPLPFAFGPIPPERYRIFAITKPLGVSPAAATNKPVP